MIYRNYIFYKILNFIIILYKYILLRVINDIDISIIISIVSLMHNMFKLILVFNVLSIIIQKFSINLMLINFKRGERVT